MLSLLFGKDVYIFLRAIDSLIEKIDRNVNFIIGKRSRANSGERKKDLPSPTSDPGSKTIEKWGKDLPEHKYITLAVSVINSGNLIQSIFAFTTIHIRGLQKRYSHISIQARNR